MADELNRSTIEEHANLTWPKRMERYDGYCVRDGHPGDATSAQEYMTDEEDNFDIIHFIDEGISFQERRRALWSIWSLLDAIDCAVCELRRERVPGRDQGREPTNFHLTPFAGERPAVPY